MLFQTDSFISCVYITVLVLMLVVLMPAVDIFVCKKLRLDVIDGISENPKADVLLRIRSVIIFAVFIVYFAGFSYITFFSRAASEDYLIHVALFEDLAGSVRIDFGILGILYNIFTGNFSELSKHIEIIRFSGISQVYLNVMLFIPMGYLLPYMSKWFRKKLPLRPAAAGFVMSMAIENIQLITKHGFYDVDDMVTNTLGGYIGAVLFVAFAFRITHPNWKKDLKRYRLWKKNARKRTLYPFARKVNLSRSVIFATDETVIWDFYVMKLGFRVIRQLVPEDDPGTSFLLALGSSQVEIRCSNRGEVLPKQYLYITAGRLSRVRKRLEDNGIEVSPFREDPYTKADCMSFEAPDNVTVVILSE